MTSTPFLIYMILFMVTFFIFKTINTSYLSINCPSFEQYVPQSSLNVHGIGTEVKKINRIMRCRRCVKDNYIQTQGISVADSLSGVCDCTMTGRRGGDSTYHGVSAVRQ